MIDELMPSEAQKDFFSMKVLWGISKPGTSYLKRLAGLSGASGPDFAKATITDLQLGQENCELLATAFPSYFSSQ
ncbi:MAG: hypothetical protein GY807_22585 [Gammaproteobacteria bacterium]|nr:hypothetical protein [Gammaproteobacteria bacterium]